MVFSDSSLRLKRRNVALSDVSAREFPESFFVPYLGHYDHETIITHNNELMKTIRIEGFSFETADDEDVDMKKMVRNSLFKSMADGRFACWFHLIRRRQSAYPAGTMPAGFADFMDKEWRRKHHSRDLYTNELYITIVRKQDKEGAAILTHMFEQFAMRTDRGAKDQSMRDAHKELTEAVYRVLATLKDYSPHVLTVVDTPNGSCSEPLAFLRRLANAETAPVRVAVPAMDAAHYLPVNRLYFGDRAIEIRGPTKRRFGAMLSVKEYAPATAAAIMDAFLQLPFEFILSQSFTYHNRQVNIGKMQLKQRQMQNAQDVALSQVAEISDALDMAMSGHVAFGWHHLSLLCLAEDLKELEDHVSAGLSEFVNIGVNPVREKMFMEQAYWAQMPANFEFVGRKADINTLNLASFASFHNYPTGRIRGNHWGDAVSVFDTSSGTPYFFNFHLRDVGHTTIIGPTGAGKTVLMNFLVAQAQKFNCRTFMFDKDRGADIFVRALGGKYTIVQPGDVCGFNPLQLPDTAENRTFLAEWLKALVTVHDEPFTSADMARVEEAVAGNYKLAPKDRRLRNIAPFLGIEGPGTLAGRLRMWHGNGQFAGVFDNETDAIDFNLGRVFGFEMGEVLASRVTLGPVLLYLFHRIHLSLDGTPTLIVLDEAWALIDNKTFAGKIREWLKTLRKLNGMVVFATQSVEDAASSAISDTLIQQTSTQIFLPNPKANELYRKAFLLSEREFSLLKTTDPGSRFFLLRQGKDVVVARIDLSGMHDIIQVLSGRAETVAVADQVREAFGDDPDRWLPEFYDRVRRVSHG